MSDWDTAPITLRKRVPKASTLKTEKAVNDARRQGYAVETQAKWGGGANRQHVTTKNTAKLDRETEELKHDHVPLELGKLIQQGRQNKGLSQKDLATKVNEKAQVINDYEAGRGIPNQMVIGKIERVLGIKLRGKDRGKPLTAPGRRSESRGEAMSIFRSLYIVPKEEPMRKTVERNATKKKKKYKPLTYFPFGYTDIVKMVKKIGYN